MDAAAQHALELAMQAATYHDRVLRGVERQGSLAELLLSDCERRSFPRRRSREEDGDISVSFFSIATCTRPLRSRAVPDAAAAFIRPLCIQ